MVTSVIDIYQLSGANDVIRNIDISFLHHEVLVEAE
jgi:hypothetical protein